MKLHLGCNKINIPGYTNIDIATFPHIDHVHDIKSLPMIESDSVDEIYTSQTFMYFNREEGIQALTEWNRVLKKGGVLRLSTVDFAKLIEVYQKYGEVEKVVGPMYGQMPADELTIYHRTIYDMKSLTRVLEKCHFGDVKRYDWRERVHLDFDDQSQAYVPHMDKENGILINLNIEAIKI